MSDFLEQFTLSNIIFNVFCSLISSIIFIFGLLYFLKPNIKIVEKIATKEIDIDGSGKKKAFLFKIINKSYFSAYEINAQLSSYKIVQGENGIIDHLYTHLPLRNNKVSHINGYNPFKNNGENCIIFVSYEDIETLLSSENNSIQLLISAKHGLSGLNHIFKFSFTTENYIKRGKFKSGNCEDIC